MNCVSWNCRGLGNQQRVQEPSELMKAKSPNFVFLMETRKKNSYIERLRCRLKFDNLFIVPRRNRGGGLTLLWMDDLNLLWMASGQRLPQIMLGRQANLDLPCSYVIEIPINLIEHLLVLIRVCF